MVDALEAPARRWGDERPEMPPRTAALRVSSGPMRVRNKEIRARRKRKEETIKLAEKAIRAQFAGKSAAKKPAPKK